jgi:hypothetical protein
MKDNNINGVISTSSYYEEAWKLLCYRSETKGEANPMRIRVMGTILVLEDKLFGGAVSSEDVSHDAKLELFDKHAAYQLAINDYDELHGC